MKKTAPDGAKTETQKQTDGHGDSKTESAQWGRCSENLKNPPKSKTLINNLKMSKNSKIIKNQIFFLLKKSLFFSTKKFN